MSVLEHILQAVQECCTRDEHPVVVFDLDSTLIQTAFRHERILREFADDFGELWSVLDDVVPDVTVDEFQWTVGGPLRRRGIEGPPELFDTLFRYWVRRFFDGDYLSVDQAYPGAVDYVHAVYEAGAQIAYVTGRPAPLMAEQTLQSLVKLGFPACVPRVSLSLKPTVDMADLAYKQLACEQLAQVGTVIATFENEPGNANAFLAAFPEATHVLMETVHSPDAPSLDPRVKRVGHF